MCIMEVGKRDLIVRILNEQLGLLQTKNVDRMKELEKRQNENEFLAGVYNDYRNHHDYMYHMKHQQQRQIEYLVGYLDKSLEQSGLSNSMLKRTKHERLRLHSQIDQIKNEIDEMIRKDKILLGR